MPRVFVWVYEEGGFLNTPNAWTSREDTKVFKVRRVDAVAVPTVVVFYEDRFREGWGHKWTTMKIVVVDEGEERFRKLVEAVKELLEREGYQPPVTYDEIIDVVSEVFDVNEYSGEKLLREREGYAYERLVYLLVP